MSDKEKDYIETPELEGKTFEEILSGVSDMTPPVDSIDVAKYILDKLPDTTPLRLQKLCYYCQAWSLVWDEKPLFKGVIEAWVNGPIIPSLHIEKEDELVLVDMTNASPSKLGELEQQTIDAVLDFCKDRDTEWLVELSKKERPWKDARASLKDADSNPVIMHKALYDYYSNIE